MVKKLQKTANFYRENVGVMDPEGFARHVDMQFYESSSDLKTFVTHYFIARFKLGDDSYEASDVLSRPDVHIVFTPSEASILGVARARRSLRLEGDGVYTGIRFTTAGFRSFWRKPMSALADHVFPLTEVFPDFNHAALKQLLAKKDAAIVASFDAMLRACKPADDPKIELLDTIVEIIENDAALTTTPAVARAFNLSERTLQQLFKTYVGVSVKWVIMRIRLLQAVRHAHSDKKPNWTTIAHDLGYSTQSHFNNDFRKIIGQTPREYMQSIAILSS